MSPLRIIQRLHGPIVCLVIACLVSVGCKSSEQTVFLGKPTQAYQASNGAVMLGYNVQAAVPSSLQLSVEPAGQPEYVGWHWLVIEPATAKRLLEAVAVDAPDAGDRAVTVNYKGWGRNARLIPPLLEPGRRDATPPALGDGDLTQLSVSWDSALGGPRLMNSSYAMFPVILVSPDAQTLRAWTYDRELMLDVLKVAAVAGLIVGLVLLGGSGSVSVN